MTDLTHPKSKASVLIMRSFSALFSATRRAQAVSRGHIPTPRPSYRHHEYEGSSHLLRGLVASSTPTSISLPSQRLSIQDHVSHLHHQHRGLLSRQFIHCSARVEQPEMISYIEIISEEYIKPASPTPNHLRTYKLSILDQFFFPSYTPCILYFHNRTAETGLTDSIVSVSNKLKGLKASLSELLIRFYPFAGRIKDDFEIECNDQGVYFAEARVNRNLLDFLSQPDDQTIQGLIPRHASATASTFGNYVVSVQVNVFDCGGIALSTSVSHKLIDGSSYFTFLNAWAATSRGSSKVIYPSFMATSLFPQSRHQKNRLPTKLVSAKCTITRRFVISATALASLKGNALSSSSSVHGPTRVEAASSLIWKCAAKAASQVRSFGQQSPYVLFSFVDIRRRDLPPLPDVSIGNLIVAAIAVCFPKIEPELSSLMGQVKQSFASINYDLFSKFKGEEGYLHVDKLLKMCTDLFELIDEGDCLALTSLCNSGIYGIDFGWGRPVWFSYINPGSSRIVALADTVKGDGIEATVSLSPEEMAIFECDPELLSYASVDLSPLKILGLDSHGIH